MTDPDLERLAKQSGLYISAELRIFAALIEAHERERCAKLCDELPRTRSHVNADVAWYAAAAGCAAAIRAL